LAASRFQHCCLMEATKVGKSSPACKSLQLFSMCYLYRCFTSIASMSLHGAMCARLKWSDIFLEQARAGSHCTDHVKEVLFRARTTTGLRSDFWEVLYLSNFIVHITNHSTIHPSSHTTSQHRVGRLTQTSSCVQLQDMLKNSHTHKGE
jgi:hypothetical protein